MMPGREVVVEVLLRMDRRIQQLEARVGKLERELRKSSRNSSRPPSSDPPSSPPRSKDPCGRKRGAQEGHEGHGRPLLPAWAVDEIVEHWPERCRCGYAFSARGAASGRRAGASSGRRAAADQRQGDRASLPAAALPRLRQAHARGAARRGCSQLLRAATASGGSDAVGAQPRLARRRRGVRRRAVRRAHQLGHGRRDPRSCRPGA